MGILNFIEYLNEDVTNTVNVNPDMNVQGMGDVTMTSGDLGAVEDDDEMVLNHKKKRKKFKFIKDLSTFVEQQF